MVVNKLINGEMDENTFVLTQFKHMRTQSVISRERLEAICSYLMKEVESGEEEHFITLNDQMPVRISHDEMRELLNELIEIQGKLN